MPKPRLALVLAACLVLPAGLRAAGGTYQGYGGHALDFENAQLPHCEKVKEMEETCPIVKALRSLWDSLSTEETARRRVTEEMDAERAALDWARHRYAGTRYKVRITGVEERTKRGLRRAAPRVITLAVEARDSDWMTRVQVLASQQRQGWRVNPL